MPSGITLTRFGSSALESQSVGSAELVRERENGRTGFLPGRPSFERLTSQPVMMRTKGTLVSALGSAKPSNRKFPRDHHEYVLRFHEEHPYLLALHSNTDWIAWDEERSKWHRAEFRRYESAFHHALEVEASHIEDRAERIAAQRLLIGAESRGYNILADCVRRHQDEICGVKIISGQSRFQDEFDDRVATEVAEGWEDWGRISPRTNGHDIGILLLRFPPPKSAFRRPTADKRKGAR